MTRINVKYEALEYRAVWIFPQRHGIFSSISVWDWAPTKVTWSKRQLCAAYSHYNCICGENV